MPIISKARYRELLQAESTLGKIDEEDRKASKDNSKQIARIRRDHQNELDEQSDKHVEAMRLQGRKHVEAIAKMQDQVDAANDKAAKAEKEAARKAAKDLQEKIDEHEADVKSKTAYLDVRVSELSTTKLNLDAREKRLKTREDALEKSQKELDEQVAKHAKAVATARQEGEAVGEKRGFANGLADGIRKIGEHTQKAHDKNTEMGNKALDAVIEAAKKEVPTPQVHTLSVPVVNPSTINNSNHQ